MTQTPETSFIINIDGTYVGLAQQDGANLRFIASDPRFSILDGSRFRRPDQLYQAVRTMARLVYADNVHTAVSSPSLTSPANDGYWPAVSLN